MVMLRNAERQDDHQVAWKRMKMGLPWATSSVEEICWSWERVRVKSGARSPTRVPTVGAEGCVGSGVDGCAVSRVDGAAVGGSVGVGAGSDPAPQARAMRRGRMTAVGMIHRMFGYFIGAPASVLLCVVLPVGYGALSARAWRTSGQSEERPCP